MGNDTLGLILGTGLDPAELAPDFKKRKQETPYGAPATELLYGSLSKLAPDFEGDTRLVLLARHGKGGKIPAHKVNHLANLWALKELGCTAILTTSSVGGLQEELVPGTLLVPHDYICTYPGPTIYDEKPQHILPESDQGLRQLIIQAAASLDEPAVPEGIYMQTFGPRFETKAEVVWYGYGGQVIGMTMAHEATVAQELGLPYASLCKVDNLAHGLGEGTLTMETVRAMSKETGERAWQILLKAAELFE